MSYPTSHHAFRTNIGRQDKGALKRERERGHERGECGKREEGERERTEGSRRELTTSCA